jgi:hypothetical protein
MRRDDGQRSGGGRGGESPSTLIIIMNYLCSILFLIFLLIHLSHEPFLINWFIVVLPLLPAHLGLLYLYYQDLMQIRSSSFANKIQIYCYLLDTFSYLLTIILLYLHFSQNYPSVTLLIALAPLPSIALLTLTVRSHFLPSLSSSREWTQGYRHLFSLCIIFFNFLLRVVLPLFLILRLESEHGHHPSRRFSWWMIFCPVWIVITMCLICSLRLLYHAIITNRNALTMRHHAASLMVLFGLQLFIGSVAILIGSVRLDPDHPSLLTALDPFDLGSFRDSKEMLSRTIVSLFRSLSPWSGS